jgi:hypothetical protein
VNTSYYEFTVGYDIGILAALFFLFLLVLDLIVDKIKSKHFEKNVWIYGTIRDGRTRARKNKRTKQVQSVVCKVGEHGNIVSFWHDTDPYWWPTFIAGEVDTSDTG